MAFALHMQLALESKNIALKTIIFRKPLEQSNDLLAAVKNEVELDAKQVKYF